MDKTHSSKARSVFAASVILITVVTTFSILKGVTSAAAPSTVTPSKDSPSANQCGPDWQVVPSPNPSNANSNLNGITAVDANDIWAVGSSSYASATLTLIEHWDGVSWSIVLSPNPSATNDALNAVAAVAANNVWAVGRHIDVNVPSRILIEHWDGTSWSVVPGTEPGPHDNALMGVTAIAADNVWAVGWGGTSSESLVEHWDGSAWSVVPGPNSIGGFAGVAAVNGNDIWAVGYTEHLVGHELYFNTLVEHWDGSVWSVVPNPNPDPQVNILFGVAAVSANDVWAVGSYGGVAEETLIEHWNGSAWSVVPSPNRSTSDSFSGVAAVSANDVWAVGGSNGGTLVEHWNGSTWSIVPSPNVGSDGDSLSAVAVVAATDVLGVGNSCCPNRTLVERYNPCIPVTPTPQPPPCPGERFTDVCPTDYFYTDTLSLADDGILSGYNTSPPCLNDLWIPCFNPYSSSTRGQISKVVSLAAGFSEPVSGQRFEDVPPGSTFYTYTERIAERSIISGYPCGGSGEPCVPPDNRPYFRTNSKVTRGQLSKMVSLAFGWNDRPVGQDFEDVLPGSTFYTYVAQLHSRSITQGYPCDGAGEPCVPPDNLPYFRPNSNVTRGQTAKIVQLARTQPTPTPTAVATLTAVATMTATSVATSTLPVSTDTPAPAITSTTTPTETATLTTR